MESGSENEEKRKARPNRRSTRTSSTPLPQPGRPSSQQPEPRVKPGQKKRGPILVEVNSSKITIALKTLLKTAQTPQEFDGFLADQQWLAAFSPRTNRSPEHRKDRGNIFHHLVAGTTEWPEEDIRKILEWLLNGVRPVDAGTSTEASTLTNTDTNTETNTENNAHPTDAGATTCSKASGHAPKPPFRNLLEERGDLPTPVHTALENHRRYGGKFVHALLKIKPPPENLGRVLCMPKSTNDPANCLHAAIDGRFPDLHLIMDAIKFQCQPVERHHAFSARDSATWNTPLHLAVKHIPKWGGGLPTLWDKLSPEHLEFLGGNDGINRTNPGRSCSRANMMLSLIEELVLSDIDVLANQKRKLASEPPENNPAVALTTSNRHGRTPYQERIYHLDRKWDRAKNDGSGDDVSCGSVESNNPVDTEKGFRSFVLSDPVASFISYYCIKHLNRMQAIPCLYHSGKERAIDFTLEGFAYPSISNSDLKRLETHFKLERTLKWVALPRIKVTAKGADSSKKGKGVSSRRGREDMEIIFKWLHSQGVRKILRVTVIDDEFPAHKDASIISCLEKFGVEVWDWKKIDICSDVISRATSVVREIYLYSSGNQSVLKGWAAEGAFSDRKKFPKLSKIGITFREGQEDRRTLNDYGRNFKSELANQIGCELKTRKALPPGHNSNSVAENGKAPAETVQGIGREAGASLEVTYDVDSAKRPESSQIGSRVDPSNINNSRIDQMTKLTKFLQSPDRFKDLKPVKIAILDDGLDSAFDTTEFHCVNIITGTAFSPSSPERVNSYFVPTGSHGTQIATLICQICPRTDLYIARLEEQVSQGGRRMISAASAVQAIQWATKCNVDIICMSWTIETPGKTKAPDGLKEAIIAAREAGIVMFCSASDQGGSSANQCWPGGVDQSCIRIGSCNSLDLPSSMVRHDLVDFLLPGENILVADRDGTPQFHEGSSFATAIAAGLGGQLMSIGRMINSGSPHPHPEEHAPARSWTRKWWCYETMMQVLRKNAIKLPPLDDCKLLKPEYGIIDKYYEQLRKLLSSGEIELIMIQPLEQQKWSDKSLQALRETMDTFLTVPDAVAYGTGYSGGR